MDDGDDHGDSPEKNKQRKAAVGQVHQKQTYWC